MKKRYLCMLMIVLFAAGVSAGCQKTPESAIVAEKNTEAMLEKGMQPIDAQVPATTEGEIISYARLCDHYGVPERWQVDMSEVDGKLAVSADVTITLPNSFTMPIVKVTAGRFSQDLTYTMFHYFCKDTPMYVHPDINTKESIANSILSLQQQADAYDPVHEAEKIDTLNSWIEQLRKEYEAAPESITLIQSDGTLDENVIRHEGSDAADGKNTGLYIVSEPFVDNAMTFSVNNDADYDNTSVDSFVDEQGNTQVVTPQSGSRFAYYREGAVNTIDHSQSAKLMMDVTAQSLTGERVDSLLETTPVEARKVVEAFLADCGIENMTIDSVQLRSNQTDTSGYPEPAANEVEQKPEKQGYLFRLLRSVNGVAVESIYDASSAQIDGADYGIDWWYETLYIVVDDAGILSAEWMAPLNMAELLTENANLLSFSKIEAIFEKMIVVMNAPYANNDEYTRIDFAVDTVKLCLWRIVDTNSFTNGFLIPVWNFYCTETYYYSDGEVLVNPDDPYHPTITINAIDGSIIDRELGY